MHMIAPTIIIIISIFYVGNVLSVTYEPNWKSLDSRPLPKWYDESKIGIFIHWGVYSVPSYGSPWFWKSWKRDNNPLYVEFMKKNYPPNFTYQNFGPMFTAELFDPTYWAELFTSAGARYVVLTSKHHEGYTLWPSKHSFGWNSKDVGPNKDLVGELFSAIRKKNPSMRLGLYYSLLEWFHPSYLKDRENKWKTKTFVNQKTMPELIEIVENYKPDVIWSDGDWAAPDKYWNSVEYLAWLFNESPVNETVVVNDRWGSGTMCHHGSFYTCKDRYNPRTLQSHKWENCMTLDKHAWVFNRLSKAKDYMTIHELLKTMAETISCGGNLLVNVGPTHDGRIPAIMDERLREMGEWLAVNGKAIYRTKPWAFQNDTVASDVWYTQNKHSPQFVYAIMLNWPKFDNITLGSIKKTSNTTVKFLGYSGKITAKQTATGLELILPQMSSIKSKWAWVISLKNIDPYSHMPINNEFATNGN